MKKIFVNEITRENMEVNDLFMVVKKGAYTTKNNTKYISISLKDKTGLIEGRIWDNVDALDSMFSRNDIVEVRGTSRFYQERPQLTIFDIKRVAEDLSIDDMRGIFSESPVGLEGLKEDYLSILKGIENPYLASLFFMLNKREDLIKRFFFFPASIGVHHFYINGLFEHSISVAKMASSAVDMVGGDKEIVIAGSLLHDIGKVEEIEVKAGFRHTDRGRLLGHIALGVIILEDVVREIPNFPIPLSDMLSHIIVSHHGIEEWGSPKRPMSIEAIIVHHIDNLDARVKGAMEYMRDNMEDERWSGYHRLYAQRFYKLNEGQ